METRELITSKGRAHCERRVPCSRNHHDSSDGAAHNFTIATLPLEATMIWMCVPKEDVKVLRAIRFLLSEVLSDGARTGPREREFHFQA
jgi:hypothetical protein